MTQKIISVKYNQTVEEVEKMMLEFEHDSFPVVNDGKEVIGMISISDILLKDPGLEISDLMSRRVIAASPEMKIEDTARLMFRNGVSRLPVLDENGKIAGIISNTDIIRAHIERVTPSKLLKIKTTMESVSGVRIYVKDLLIRIDGLIPTQNKIDADELEGRKYELKKGLAEPIVVIRSAGGDLIVDGHHRALAAHKLGIKKLDAHLLLPEKNVRFGLENEAERLNLRSVEDMKVGDARPPALNIIR